MTTHFKLFHWLRPGSNRSRGVTLIEVLIVVAIIAMVAGAASVGAMKAFGNAAQKTAINDARIVRTAVKAYWLEEGTDDCPTVERLVLAGALESDGRRADPWGQPFKIDCSENEVKVTSAGKDKRMGTPDDVVVPAR